MSTTKVLRLLVVLALAGVGGLVPATATAAVSPHYAVSDVVPLDHGAYLRALRAGPGGVAVAVGSEACGTHAPACYSRLVTSDGAGGTRVLLRTTLPLIGLAVDPVDGTVYTTFDSDGTSVLLGYRDGRLVSALRIPEAGGLAVDHARRTVWVTGSTGLTPVVDGAVGASVPLGFAPAGPVIDPATGTVHVLDLEHPAVVSVRGGRQVGRVALAAYPRDMALNDRSGTLFVLLRDPDVYDRATLAVVRDGRVAKTLTFDALATAVAADPAGDGAFVTTYEDRAVRLIAGDAEVAATDAGTAYPTALTVDPEGGVHVAGGTIGLSLGGGEVPVLKLTDRPALTRFGPVGFNIYTAQTAPVYAVFSQPMDTAATAAALTVEREDGRTVPGSVTWFGDQVAVFTAAPAFPSYTRVRVSIGAGARDADGRPLVRETSWGFYTPPGSADLAFPASGATGVAVTAPIVIRFFQPMDRPSAEVAFTLHRARTLGGRLPGRFGWLSSTVMAFVPDAPLDPAVTYEVIEANTALDLAGGGSNYLTWQFTTAG